jgi:predicted tellurium resistance membrane protein TerC
MMKNFNQIKLRAKAMIWVVGFVLILSGLNFATFSLLRDYMNKLSQMTDVVVIANDLKLLTGTVTEGLPFEIEDYSLYPTTERKKKILSKFEKIEKHLEALHHEINDPEAKIQVFQLFPGDQWKTAIKGRF